jgi:hypothetical protein
LLDPDPDPEFQVNPDPDTDPNPWLYNDQKLMEKNTANFCISFLIKSCNLMSMLQPFQPSALKREHPALQKMNFVIFFLWLLWVIFALPDPDPYRDPGTPLYSDPIRIPDPDPQQ